MTRPIIRTRAALSATLVMAGAIAWSSVGAHALDLTARMDGDFDTLDPQKTASTDRSFFILPMLYERLIKIDGDGNFVPVIAESYTVTADKIDFVIRRGITCNDGHELTAGDVARSLNRIVAKDTNAPSATNLGGRESFTATADDTAGTVSIALKKPFSNLLNGLALTSSSIVCPAGLDNPELMGTQSFGTGRYVMDQAQSKRGIEYVFTLREDLTADEGEPTKITVRIIENPTTAANELLAGGIDIASLRGRDQDRLDGQIPAASLAPWGAAMATFQHRDGHSTADLAVRKAVVMAIDREAAMIAGTAGRGVLTTSFMGPSIRCYAPETATLLPKASIEEARKVLEMDGWQLNANGIYEKEGTPLLLRVLTQPTSTNLVGEYLLSTLKALGAEVTLKLAAPEEVVPLSRSDTWDVRVTNLNNSTRSPFGMHVFFNPESTLNTSTVNNAVYNENALKAISISPEDEEYCPAWSRAQLAILEEFDAMPLYSAVDSVYHREGLTFDFIIPTIPDLSSVRMK